MNEEPWGWRLGTKGVRGPYGWSRWRWRAFNARREQYVEALRTGDYSKLPAYARKMAAVGR